MIKVVTDTTSALTIEEYHKYGISPVPLYIREGDNMKKEMLELSYGEFYSRQRAGAKFTTSQPDPNSFLETFRSAIESGDEVICVTISSGISGTFNSANLAKEMLNTDKISIIDSYQSGFNQGAMALKAVELAAAGESREQIAAHLEEMRKRTRIYFVVESLRYLYEGGRLNGAQALIGSMIQIKPIVWFDNRGIMTTFEKVRTLKNAKNRVLELFKKDIDAYGLEQVGLHYGDNKEEAESYAKQLEEITGRPVPLVQLSPVIGAHTGPDILGVCFVAQKPFWD
ncbi:MAG: DegV family protein [Firmicutes bacterium]|nr:DegV family protein [Bacillota bacterium]